jgi:uncharacterized protein involved in exopolysaccharide biosynthesis
MEGGGPTGGSPAIGLTARMAWLPRDVPEALGLLRRHWLLLAACGVAGVVALNAAAVVSGPTYVVTAKIMVNLGPEMVGSPLPRRPCAGPRTRPQASKSSRTLG